MKKVKVMSIQKNVTPTPASKCTPNILKKRNLFNSPTQVVNSTPTVVTQPQMYPLNVNTSDNLEAFVLKRSDFIDISLINKAQQAVEAAGGTVQEIVVQKSNLFQLKRAPKCSILLPKETYSVKKPPAPKTVTVSEVADVVDLTDDPEPEAPVQSTPFEFIPVEPPPLALIPVEPPPLAFIPVEPPPLDFFPVEPAPLEFIPVEPAPLEFIPVEPAPIEPTPVECAPVESPIESTPVESTPVESTPVESTPVESTPQTISISICRTCLKPTPGDSCHRLFDVGNNHSTSLELRRKLEAVTESIDFLASLNPTVCKDCFAAINTAYTFRKQVEMVEDHIKKKRKNLSTIVNLKCLLQEIGEEKSKKNQREKPEEINSKKRKLSPPEKPEVDLKEYLTKRSKMIDNFVSTLQRDDGRSSKPYMHSKSSDSVSKTSETTNHDDSEVIILDTDEVDANEVTNVSKPRETPTKKAPKDRGQVIQMIPLEDLLEGGNVIEIILDEDDYRKIVPKQKSKPVGSTPKSSSSLKEKSHKRAFKDVGVRDPVFSAENVNSPAPFAGPALQNTSLISDVSLKCVSKDNTPTNSFLIPTGNPIDINLSLTPSKEIDPAGKLFMEIAELSPPLAVTNSPQTANPPSDSVATDSGCVTTNVKSPGEKKVKPEYVPIMKKGKKVRGLEAFLEKRQMYMEMSAKINSAPNSAPGTLIYGNRKKDPKPPETFDLFDKAHDEYFKELGDAPGDRMVEKWRKFTKQVSRSNAYPYLCEDCGKVFYKRTKFMKHIENHQQPELAMCSYCGIQIKRRYLKMHVLKHHMPRRHQCEECGKKFAAKFLLTAHIEQTHKARNTLCQCQVCGVIVKKISLRIHLSTHSSKQYTCQICNVVFDNYYTWYSHHRTKHLNIKRAPVGYTCQICGKTLKSQDNFKKHMRAFHEGVNKQCDICGKYLSRRQSMERHMKIVHERTIIPQPAETTEDTRSGDEDQAATDFISNIMENNEERVIVEQTTQFHPNIAQQEETTEFEQGAVVNQFLPITVTMEDGTQFIPNMAENGYEGEDAVDTVGEFDASMAENYVVQQVAMGLATRFVPNTAENTGGDQEYILVYPENHLQEQVPVDIAEEFIPNTTETGEEKVADEDAAEMIPLMTENCSEEEVPVDIAHEFIPNMTETSSIEQVSAVTSTDFTPEMTEEQVPVDMAQEFVPNMTETGSIDQVSAVTSTDFIPEMTEGQVTVDTAQEFMSNSMETSTDGQVAVETLAVFISHATESVIGDEDGMEIATEFDPNTTQHIEEEQEFVMNVGENSGEEQVVDTTTQFMSTEMENTVEEEVESEETTEFLSITVGEQEVTEEGVTYFISNGLESSVEEEVTTETVGDLESNVIENTVSAEAYESAGEVENSSEGAAMSFDVMGDMYFD